MLFSLVALFGFSVLFNGFSIPFSVMLMLSISFKNSNCTSFKNVSLVTSSFCETGYSNWPFRTFALFHSDLRCSMNVQKLWFS